METTNWEKMKRILRGMEGQGGQLMETTNWEKMKRILRGMEGQSRQVRGLAKISSGARQLAMETPPLRGSTASLPTASR